MATDKTTDKPRMLSLDELEDWLSTTQAARILDLSQQRIIQMAAAGELGDVAYTTHGRLFDPDAVEAVRKERERAPR